MKSSCIGIVVLASFTAVSAEYCGGTLDEGTFQIKHEPSGKCLDLRGGVAQNGQAIQLWDCNGHTNQNWFLSCDAPKTSTKTYPRLHLDSDRKFCLDVPGGQGKNGSRLQLWECADASEMLPGQEWRWYSGTGSGSWWILGPESRNSSLGGFTIDLTGGVTSNGNAIEIWHNIEGNPNQNFVPCDVASGIIPGMPITWKC
jgi:hypothetical protein